MRKRYKVVLSVEIDNPDEPFPAGGDYKHKSRIAGIIHSIVTYYWAIDGATVTLDKVIDKGEIDTHDGRN